MLQTYQSNMKQFLNVHIPHWTPYAPAGLDCIAINDNEYGKIDHEGLEQAA
jgi:hypothetical protein